MRFILSAILLISVLPVMAQKSFLKVNYKVQATLDERNKTIGGFWQASVTNLSDSNIHTIWVHLYPNAFSSDSTNYCNDLLKWGITDLYFAKKNDAGYIDSLQFSLEQGNNSIKKIENKEELVGIYLSEPLKSGDSIMLSTTFFTQLPYDFYENGYKGDIYTVKAWIPLIALLDENGWHKKPFSLFSENATSKGDFDIHLTFPKNYQFESDAQSITTNQYVLKNTDRFVWRAFSSNIDRTTLPKSWKERQIPIATIARQLYPAVFHSRRSPQDTIAWLEQVYSKYRRPIPFTSDSLFYVKNSSDQTIKSTKLGFLYDFRNTEKNKYFFLSPAVGFNNYDKFMAGALFHNYQLPSQAFQFAIAPMYAFGSKKVTGAGHLGYNIWGQRTHWEIAASGLTYSWRDFDVSPYPKFYQRMTRIVPSVNVTVFDKDINSTQKWDFTARSFILNVQNYQQRINGVDTSFGNVTANATLFQFQAGVSDSRKLYPYSINAVVDQGKEFLRIGLTGKYFFNYDATNRGISARFFAGKFFSLKDQTFNSSYSLSLSGPSGNNDYTYSDYFIGRNEYNGWMGQQIMERDGFFKVSTLRMNGFGLSDNWLSSLNLAADIPDNWNPLNVLPFKVPLKLFFDIGTYSDLWEDVPPAGRFLYDAGLQIPIYHSLVNIYVPLLYSKIFRDTYKSNYPKNYFWRTISFNIDLSILKKHISGR